MSKFQRGNVIYHKTMGVGVVLNETNDGKVEVRMQNGHIEKFFPEELETEQKFLAKNKNDIDDKNWRIGS